MNVHQSINTFADQLIKSKDLDPVYVALCQGILLDEEQKKRWLLAYWCFYHMGVASYMSEFTDGRYWDQMMKAAVNDHPSPLNTTWPRGTERRHFRGLACIDAIEHLWHQPAEQWVESLRNFHTATAIILQIKAWPQFGPWIAFKVADMLEVVMGWQVQFQPDLPLIYKEPAAGIELLRKDGLNVTPQLAFQSVIDYVSSYKEPAAGRRFCGVQEAETVLCKYKSYRHGKYHVGKDTHEIRHALAGWGDTAAYLLRLAPGDSQ